MIILQNKAIRLVSGAKRRAIIWNERTISIPAHTDPLYKKLNVLKMTQIYMYSVQQFVFKYHHGLLQTYLTIFIPQTVLFTPITLDLKICSDLHYYVLL